MFGAAQKSINDDRILHNSFSWIVYIRNMSAFLFSYVKARMGIDVDDGFLSSQ